jgi:uncharacterized protein
MKQKVTYHVTSVYDIPDSFFRESGIKALVVDLDNTLDSAYTNIPRPEAFQLKQRLKDLGIEMIIVSNNSAKRVDEYCKKLDVHYLSSAQKFRKGKISKFLILLGYRTEDCLFVGDQLFTDRVYVNKMHGRLILTEPLVKKDQFFTRFVRGIDNSVRKRWKKKGILGKTIEKEDV